MSKISKIRWRDSDTAELKRAVKNFNAKITRLTKKSPELVPLLPDKLSVKDLKNNITTRADFSREINSLGRFTKRGSEKVVKSSRGAQALKWDINEFNIKQRTENARRARKQKKLDEIEMKSRGKSTGLKRGEMGSINRNALNPSKKKFKNLSQKEWEKAKEAMNNLFDVKAQEQKKERFQQNYIKGLKDMGYSDSLIKLVESKSPDEFVEIFNTDTEAQFDFIYDPLELQTKQEALFEVWKGEE